MKMNSNMFQFGAVIGKWRVFAATLFGTAFVVSGAESLLLTGATVHTVTGENIRYFDGRNKTDPHLIRKEDVYDTARRT